MTPKRKLILKSGFLRFRMQAARVLGLFLVLLQLAHALLLGAFNIRSFGDTKASNVTLMNVISEVCKRTSVLARPAPPPKKIHINDGQG